MAILASEQMESCIFWFVILCSFQKYIVFLIPQNTERKYTRNLTNYETNLFDGEDKQVNKENNGTNLFDGEDKQVNKENNGTNLFDSAA